ncbi:LADA_0B10990g1_1 [Lachancea dasiensis]|uniref:LADA_0B10990g1_1 n=1 Tax=Lachancea dasiensis TaxID=1072105 RepID=A0A1G4IVH7_9SACH|nr:LADA_0B10990g1_1 [Lachancea dasiensis]
MKVFMTGASGYVGSAVAHELLTNGHTVLALTRSKEAAAKVQAFASSTKILEGDLENLEALKKGAAECDGIIHLGFVHDFDHYQECSEIDRAAVLAMLDVIKGTDKPFVYTNSMLQLPQGVPIDEEVQPATSKYRGQTESITLSYKDQGVRAISVRLPPSVHDNGDVNFIPALIEVAKKTNKSAYIGGGENVWSTVQRLDAARLYRLALEKGKAGSAYHAVAEEGVKTKDIATAIGEALSVPIEAVEAALAPAHFGFMAAFFTMGGLTSSAITRRELGWEPREIALLDDIKTNYL